MCKKYITQTTLFLLAFLAAPLHAGGSQFSPLYLSAKYKTPPGDAVRKALEKQKEHLETLLDMNKKNYGLPILR